MYHVPAQNAQQLTRPNGVLHFYYILPLPLAVRSSAVYSFAVSQRKWISAGWWLLNRHSSNDNKLFPEDYDILRTANWAFDAGTKETRQEKSNAKENAEERMKRRKFFKVVRTWFALWNERYCTSHYNPFLCRVICVLVKWCLMVVRRIFVIFSWVALCVRVFWICMNAQNNGFGLRP